MEPFPFRHQIIGVGESIVDFLIQVDEAFLRKGIPVEKGHAFTVSTQEEFDRFLALCPSPPIQVPGGSAANTIRALAKLGIRCAFVSRLGADQTGEEFLSNLQQHRVTPYIQRQPLVSTKKVICFITPDGQTTPIRLKVSLAEIPPPSKEFAHMDWAHFEAWRLDGTPYVEEAMRQAVLAKAKISFALSSCIRVVQDKKTILSLIPTYVDLLFGNGDEATSLTGLPPQEACLYLQTLCPIAVVTLGAKGCLVGHKNSVYTAPSFTAHPVDMMGAGDHFAAGFLYGILKQLPLSTCASIGNRLGAAAVEEIGAQLSSQSWEKIHTFLRTALPT